MGDHAHHHEESFISKYVFSQDHKMISKQFLVTAIVMGVVAVMLSVFFRLQLGWPGESFAILETFLGKWAPDGVLDRNAYLALASSGSENCQLPKFITTSWFLLFSS